MRKKRWGGVIGLGEDKRKKSVGAPVSLLALSFYLVASCFFCHLSAAPARSLIYVVSFI
jgi:hypothetical protein